MILATQPTLENLNPTALNAIAVHTKFNQIFKNVHCALDVVEWMDSSLRVCGLGFCPRSPS